MRSILCVTQQLLLDLLTDSYETWRVYAVHSWLLQRQLFNFRYRPQTGSGLFFGNRKLKTSQPEVETYLIGKLMNFRNESPIFVFRFLNPGSR